ncbi:MAG: hypothetical protein KDD84_23155, partial [Caldilineaceae bacterium]|nr:hypothetical protein [Caldilineaceae bacterium]
MNHRSRMFVNTVVALLLLGGLLLWQSMPALAWSPVQAITASTVNSIQPTAVVDSQGTRHVVWSEPVGASGREDIFYSASADGVWRAPVNISNSVDERSVTPQIGVVGAQLIVIWAEIEQFLGIDAFSSLYVAIYDGNMWTARAEISPDQNFSVGPPSLAIWNGEVHMVWAADTTLNLYGDTIMHVAWRPGDSAATLLLNAAPLPVQSGHLDAADIAFDAQGRMHMVWDGNISAAPNVHTAYEIFYTVETNGSWSAPVNISNTSEYSFLPTLAVDKAGRVHVAWMEGEDQISGGNYIFNHIYYQRWDGSKWLVTPEQLSTFDSVAFPSAITDSDGFVHLLWAESTSADTNLNFLRMRYSRWDGESLSSPVQIAPGVAGNGHSSPVIAI